MPDIARYEQTLGSSTEREEETQEEADEAHMSREPSS